MRRLVVLLLALLPLAVAPPAVAKGATEVVVTGPGIDDVSLGYTRDETDVDLGSLSETSGIYGIFGDGQFAGRPDLTDDELGPRYDLTWYQGSDLLATSHVYPFAEGGAWAQVSTGQRVYDLDLAGGWWHGGTALEAQLVALGAEPPAGAGVSTGSTDVGSGSTDVGAGSTDVGAGSPTDEAAAPAESSVPVAGIAGLAAVAMLLGGGAWLLRRRTGTLSAWPLHRST